MRNNTPDNNNNFDLIRFLAASTVWYAHYITFYGLPQLTSFEYLGRFAVDVFFIISGYFVTASFQKNANLLVYLRNRFLRIFPALAVMVLLTVFVLGPLVTSLGTKEYFAHPQTWAYLKWMLLLTKQENALPGVFTEFSTINFPLWSLRYETYCYLLIALLGTMGLLRIRYMVILFVAYWLLRPYAEDYADLSAKFIGGSIMYLARGKIPLTKAYAALALLLMLAGSQLLNSHLIFDVALTYAVIWFGFAKVPHLGNFGRFGDFSYGMYLYAFPLQQLILHHFGKLPPGIFLITSFASALAFAVASWHFVEKPALSLKSRA